MPEFIMPTPAQSDRFVATHAWLDAPAAVAELWRQTGLRCVVAPVAFCGAVGPFRVGEELAPDDLLARVAGATGTELADAGGIAVFQSPVPRPLWAGR
jgi:hypothetical protein